MIDSQSRASGERWPLLKSHDGNNQLRAYLYAAVAAVGGFLCGYDTGSISGIIALPIFQKLFFVKESIAFYESILLASFLITSMVGAFVSGYFCDEIGRKNSIMFSSSLLSIGIMMELSGFNTHILLSGRLIAGLGTGLMTNAIPLYQSEIAPSDIRGRLVSMYTSLSSFGRLIGYAVIFYSSYFQSNWAWRTPWAVQFVLSIAFLAACSSLPYSPRWLISQKRDAEGLEVLGNIYDLPKDHRIVQDEYTKIVSQIETEHRMGSEQTYADLFRGSNLKTTLTAFFISIATCFTGNVAISYFAPTIFKNAGLDDVSISLALTGGASLLSFIANMISFKWWVDTWGRRSLFLIGSAISSICMFTIGIIFYTHAEVTNGEVAIPNAQARYIVILCIYLFSASFAATWEICTYVYTAEVFSMKYRAKGLSLTYAISWAGSILITYTIPYLLLYSISGVYFFFGACSILNFIGVWFIPETKGKSLEEIDAMFE